MELQGTQGEIKIYTTPWCPFCIQAKQLLTQKKVDFQDIDVSSRNDIRAQLLELTGSRTVPQIFIHGNSVGGCDDLFALEQSGKLDAMLG